MIVITAFMMNVAGTYKKYPPRMSDMAEPMPAARAPYTGPNMIPLNTTIASPG